MSDPIKSRGQVAYEAELAAVPRYPDGGVRLTWAALPEIARWSWDRNPTPRWIAQQGGDRV